MNELAVLSAAGFVAGVMNAVAGGGTFVTIPALVWAGTPSLVANATSTVALFPGQLASTWAYRDNLADLGAVSLRSLLIVSLIGGLAGLCSCCSPPSAPSTRSFRGCCCSPP